MRIVFFGSPEFALPALDGLLATSHEIVGVVTQPDRPAGRRHALTPPPVKLKALGHGLTVLQPARVSDEASVEALRALDADVFVVAAYGQILRQRVLDLPKRGCLNVHASLLPRHRGASPIAAAILAGDEVTGVTIMEMVRALDAGPMVATVEEPVLASDTTGTLEARLAVAGARRLTEVLDGWASGAVVARPQDDALVYLRAADSAFRRTHRLVPDGGRDLAGGAGVQPVAGRAHDVSGAGAAHPGGLARSSSRPSSSRPVRCWLRRFVPKDAGSGKAETFSVQTGEGALAVLRLQRQGGKPMSGAEFLRGQRDFVGTRLGE